MDRGFFKSWYFFMWVVCCVPYWSYVTFHWLRDRPAKDTKRALNDKNKEIKE